MTTRFDTIEAFYAARGGARSGERDFGVWWTRARTRWPHFRVSVVHDTGDIYAINQTTRAVELLGTVGRPGCTADTIREHPFPCPYVAAERVLDGWTEAITSLLSLGWVMDRLETAAAAEDPVR